MGLRGMRLQGEWRRLHNGKLYDRYSSPNIIWEIESRRIRWAGHVARMEDRRYAFRVLVGRLVDAHAVFSLCNRKESLHKYTQFSVKFRLM